MGDAPYDAPKAELQVAQPVRPDITWLTNLLGVLSLLPGCLLLLGLPLMWQETLSQLGSAPLMVGLGLATALASFSGGGLLLALRPACLPLLGFSFFVGLGEIFAFQQLPSPALAWSALHLFAFVYALWLWRRNALQ